MTRLRLLPLACVAVGMLASGCAARDVVPDTSPVTPISTDLVPASLPAQKLTIDLDRSKEVKKAVQSAGPQVLVGDARLWNIHRGQRLVGALQLATLKKRVDPRRATDRQAIISQVLGGRARQIQVDGLPVWTVPDDGAGRGIYVWFGARSFGVLQLKGTDIQPAAVADALVHQIASRPAWRALPPQAYATGSA